MSIQTNTDINTDVNTDDKQGISNIQDKENNIEENKLSQIIPDNSSNLSSTILFSMLQDIENNIEENKLEETSDIICDRDKCVICYDKTYIYFYVLTFLSILIKINVSLYVFLLSYERTCYICYISFSIYISILYLIFLIFNITSHIILLCNNCKKSKYFKLIILVIEYIFSLIMTLALLIKMYISMSPVIVYLMVDGGFNIISLIFFLVLHSKDISNICNKI